MFYTFDYQNIELFNQSTPNPV